MNQITDNLESFRPISLDNINSVELMKRYDTKYIFHRKMLPSILNYLYSYYDILDIDNKRSFEYRNVYYDTDDYFFYHQHHNQRVNRYKVRLRKYVHSRKKYFEVKSTDNRDITTKKRIQLKDENARYDLTEETRAFARNNMRGSDAVIVERIKPSLGVDYSRITLVNTTDKERLTLDMNLIYTGRDMDEHRIDNLVIAELKQERFTTGSPFIRCFRDLKILQTGFSKYCMGIALTEEGVKKNRFKTKLISLNKYMSM